MKIFIGLLISLSLCVSNSMIAQSLKYSTQSKGNISSKDIQTDTRLTLPVTFSERQITLRSLCKQISEKTNIVVNTEDRFGTGDELLAVFCKDLPLSKLMNALWSNFSNKRFQWFWEIDVKGMERSYKLVQTRSAVKYRTVLHDYFPTRLEENAKTLIAAVDGTAEEKLRAQKTAFDSDKSDVFQGHGFDAEKLWTDIRALRDGMSSEELTELLRGNDGADIPFNKLNSQALDYYSKRRIEWIAFSKQTDVNVPMPDHIVIDKDNQMGIKRVLIGAPDTGFSSFSLGPGPIVIVAFAKRMSDEYILAEDLPTLATESNKLPIPTNSPLKYKTELQPVPKELEGMGLQPQYVTLPLFTMRDKYTLMFQQLAESENVPLVVWLQQDDDKLRALADIKGETFTQYKERNKFSWMMFKWQDGVQCSRFTFWALEDLPLEEKIISKFRKQVKPGEFIPLDPIAYIANAASHDQLFRLGTEFPALINVPSGLLVLKLINSFPDLLSESTNRKKMPVNSRMLGLIHANLPLKVLKSFGDEEPAFIQVSVSGKFPSIGNVSINLYDHNGKLMHSTAFANVRQPKTAPRSNEVQSMSQH